MSAAEFAEWQEYYKLEPFGEWRGDLRIGVLAALTANMRRNPDVRPEPFVAKDFMPLFDEEPEAAQTQDELVATVRMLRAMYSGDNT